MQAHISFEIRSPTLRSKLVCGFRELPEEKCAQLSRAKINYNRIKGRQILNAALLEECVEFTNIKA